MTRDEIFAALLAMVDVGARAVSIDGVPQLAVQPAVFEMITDLLYAGMQGEAVMARVRRDLGLKDETPAPAVNAPGVGRA